MYFFMFVFVCVDLFITLLIAFGRMISLYKYHLGKISGVLLFFILFLISGCYYSSTQNLFRLQKITAKPHIATQYSNLRILSTDNEHFQKNTKKQSILNRDTLLLVIVIICIVVFTLGILICVICIVRVIFRLDRTRTVGSSAYANQRNKQCYLKRWEGIQYEIFVDCFGEPYQTNCVICLEEYEYKNPLQIKIQSNRKEQQQKKLEKKEDNMREEIKNGSLTVKKSNRVENFPQVEKQSKKREVSTQQMPNNENIIQTSHNTILKTMKLTVCGHLLHSKCIEQWLQRQENCPLCRQTFSQQNLMNWQKKLDIKIFQSALVPSQNQQLQQTNNQDINSLRNTIRNSSISVQNYPTQQRAPLISSTNQTIQQIEEKQKNETQENISKNSIYSRMAYKIQQNKLPQRIKQILQTYAKIMAYHQKKRKQKQQNVLFFQSMQQEQVVNDIALSGSIYGRQIMNRKHSVNSQSQFIQYNRPRKRKRSNKNRQMSPDRLQIDNLQIQYNNQ